MSKIMLMKPRLPVCSGLINSLFWDNLLLLRAFASLLPDYVPCREERKLTALAKFPSGPYIIRNKPISVHQTDYKKLSD